MRRIGKARVERVVMATVTATVTATATATATVTVTVTVTAWWVCPHLHSIFSPHLSQQFPPPNGHCRCENSPTLSPQRLPPRLVARSTISRGRVSLHCPLRKTSRRNRRQQWTRLRESVHSLRFSRRAVHTPSTHVARISAEHAPTLPPHRFLLLLFFLFPSWRSSR